MTHRKHPKPRGVKGTCRNGKVRYATASAAKDSLDKARHSRDPKREELRSYYCPDCAGFHLTSNPKGWIFTATLTCKIQSSDGFPCSRARGHDQAHRWESPCPDEMPDVEW